ncbi:hypothetical protein HU200_049879 [Digitaria exilis]|uniref:Uncharacterized protein n=1 Tax=Digitaria exilis TaxID=1010633 RepID=A0A835A9S4_9POAL|nr:hypothetical protein HU200_058314 [Digitaria exilis]KAF8671727.1 hypothetical protein HU200_049879 [Digitaria exilis]
MASLVRVALVVAVYVVLLHSSMGQQPAPTSPPSDCTNQCTSMCTQGCQSVNSDPSKCKSAQSVYSGCFTQCTKDCKGSSCAHLSSRWDHVLIPATTPVLLTAAITAPPLLSMKLTTARGPLAMSRCTACLTAWTTA